MKKIIALVCVGALLGTANLLSTGCAASGTKQSTGAYIDDASITTKVKSAFVGDDTVKASQVKVETYNGTVQLSGFVDTAVEKERAEQIARGVGGVKGVVNNITVKTVR